MEMKVEMLKIKRESPSGDPGVSGDFGGRRKAFRDRFALQGGMK